MMDAETHQRFVQQLCHWAASYIARGRSPFRKAEPGTALTTRLGNQCPDMVLWINQDSFVAGGFIQIPTDDTDDLSAPCACAEALGVNYFATWGTTTLTIWQADNRKPVESWPIPQLTSDSLKAYEMLLVQLMDEFRTLAVLGACPPDKFSHWHLANLCLSMRSKAVALFSEHLRRTRSDTIKTRDLAEEEANNKLTLTMARMLVLLYHSQLAYSIEPENLDRALIEGSRQLHRPELDQLAGSQDEPALDDQSQVLFHHLLRRLDQIGLFKNSERAMHLLNQLLETTTEPVPEITTADLEFKDPILSIYSNRISERINSAVEIDLPQRLAFKYLLRQLAQHPHPQLCKTQLVALPSHTAPQTIFAELSSPRVPETDYRNTWQALIHAAWPGLRLQLPRHTPTWCYEVLLVLGRLKSQGVADITLPAAVLTQPWLGLVLPLLKEHYSPRIIRLQHQRLRLLLKRRTAPEQVLDLHGPYRQQHITGQEFYALHAHELALLFTAPAPLYALIEEKRLVLPTVPADDPGLKRFLLSSLADQLKRLLGDADALHLPAPAAPLLNKLAKLKLDDVPETQHQSLIDALLQQHLDIDLSADPGTENVTPAPLRINTKSVEEPIYQALDIKGVPSFPEHYLYDFYRPTLIDCTTAHPPWQIDSEFLGTFVLRDASGTTRNCDNEYLAYAALLGSTATNALHLPVDAEICRQIVERYLVDVAQIRALIWHECHAAFPTATAANRLGNKIWKTLALPPYKLVEEAMERFRINPEEASRKEKD